MLVLRILLIRTFVSLSLVASSYASIDWGECNLNFTRFDGTVAVPPQPIQCARLTVPLDYSKVNSETLDLQLLRVEATLQPSRGSIIYNPGGPGAAGTEFLAFDASQIIDAIGNDYDIVSFDPRGTGNTIPFSCPQQSFDVPPLHLLHQQGVPVLGPNLSDFANEDVFKAIESNGESCSTVESGDLIGTVFTARDMLRVVDALDEDGMLRYLGQSYGTVLGSTFAHLYPDRVSRMVLDAVLDPDSYWTGRSESMVMDADKSFLAFLQECLATPDACEAASLFPNGTVDDVLDSINSAVEAVAEIDQAMDYLFFMQAMLYSALYAPASWRWMGQWLYDFASRNFTTDILFQVPTNLPITLYNQGQAARDGIMCGDNSMRLESLTQLQLLAKDQDKLSSFAEFSFPGTWNCGKWQLRSRERLDWGDAIKTKHPVLLINSRFDPITPIQHARNVQKLMEGSRLLINGGYGHTFRTHPSDCVYGVIRHYFTDGSLPEDGTICEPNTGPFDVPVPSPW